MTDRETKKVSSVSTSKCPEFLVYIFSTYSVLKYVVAHRSTLTLEKSSFPTPGFESICALTREAIMLTGEAEGVRPWTNFIFEGRRPLLPFKLSVLTTNGKRKMKELN